MSRIKLFTLQNKETFPELMSRGFKYAKSCGAGTEGFLIALGLNFIESLILRQNSNFSNFIFIQPYLDSISEDARLRNVRQVFSEIKERRAVHDNFIRFVKNSDEVINEILYFSLSVFKIPSVELTPYEILQYLEISSTVYNLQFIIYSETDVLCEIKKNKYIYPSVLNFLNRETDESKDFYLLYHEHYQIIDPQCLNVSDEFDINRVSNLDTAEENLMKELILQIAKLPKIEENDRSELSWIISELKQVDMYGFEAEQHLDHLLNS